MGLGLWVRMRNETSMGRGPVRCGHPMNASFLTHPTTHDLQTGNEMGWLRKSKSAHPATPELCGRCGERIGVVQLERLDSSEDGPKSLWLCEACAHTLRNDATNS